MNSLSPDWQNFFVAELGALATLTGLVVVAISINLSRILTVVSLPSRAGESLIMLVGALVVVSVALVPSQPPLLLGGVRKRRVELQVGHGQAAAGSRRP